MNSKGLDAFARHAADLVSRRASILALSSAALGVAAAPRVTAARKAGKKTKQRCKRQGNQCRASITAACGDSQECLDALLPCCAFFSRCQSGPGFDCLASILD